MKLKKWLWEYKDIAVLEILVVILVVWQVQEYKLAEAVHQKLLLSSVILATGNAVLALFCVKKIKILTYLFLITALVFSIVILYYLKYIVVYKII